ncbi:hypothetical protein NY2A_b660R [Paramecium bursaria Chlorella virus NY2A]|uniref:Uncharacterized protein b660R n=1 Tax=Paramecium bursaria Chlorella virus NY2A TaxID=46021 RepID=A7IXI5_PBCVN|nr:hypothetical protein NY2A_b660R [Paramecium bursaria Chlorella virus NY2A]ABT15059.1 hypothetical protein NY2A_b660R [Paramecium bursaria Chlorella virus NY2A]
MMHQFMESLYIYKMMPDNVIYYSISQRISSVSRRTNHASIADKKRRILFAMVSTDSTMPSDTRQITSSVVAERVTK